MFEALKSLTKDALGIAPVTNWADGDDPLIQIRVRSSTRSKAYDVLLAVKKLQEIPFDVLGSCPNCKSITLEYTYISQGYGAALPKQRLHCLTCDHIWDEFEHLNQGV